MERFHRLAADTDVPPAEVARAHAECALVLGRLDGLLTGLTPTETALFCTALLRALLLSSLTQSGFADAELRFNGWLAGRERGPQETALTLCSAHAIVAALLAELRDHRWAPLAAAARTVSAAARFAIDRPDPSQDAAAEAGVASTALANAAALVEQTGARDETPLPFAALDRLNTRLRADSLFAPIERGSRSLAVGGHAVAIETTAPRTPLWAVDAALGRVITGCGAWARPLPCPGAVTAEALQPQLWAGERGLLAARSLRASALRLCDLVADARRRAALMAEYLSHLRASARAPQVWTVLAGFAPLGLDQISAAFAVSRRGTYAIGDALVTAGMARRETSKGKVLLVAQEPQNGRPSRSLDRAPALPSPALAEFDAAMAEIDRLLVRTSGRN